MGRVGKAAQRDISDAYRYLIVDKFDERDLDFIDYTEEGGCVYLGKDWENGSHQTYVVGLSSKMVGFLRELIKYKFGAIDLSSGRWHYFVWSKTKPNMICNMYHKFNDSIEGDSRRFWRVIRMLVENLRANDERTKD